MSELYGLLSRKRDHGSAFPSIDLEDVEAETSFESLEDWKRSNKLDIKYVARRDERQPWLMIQVGQCGFPSFAVSPSAVTAPWRDRVSG